MVITRFLKRHGAALCLLASTLAAAHAATYTNDFSGPGAVITHGGAGLRDGALALADGSSRTGSAIFEDIEGGGGIGALTVDFLLRVTGGGGGFSFSVAPDIQDGAFGEAGSGNGFTISFLNTGPGFPGAVIVTREGERVAEAVANFATGSFVPVRIEVGTDGALTLTVNQQTVFQDVFAYLPIPGRFGFGASTDAGGGVVAIDNLGITTTSQSGAFVLSASPTGAGASPGSVIHIQLQDFTADVDPTSVSLSFNGATVLPVVNKEGGITTVTFDPPGNLPSASENLIALSYSAGGVAQTATYRFRVAAVPVIPAAFAHQTVDQDAAGFRLRVAQASAFDTLSNSLARAEAQLRGTLTNEATGLPYENEADLSSAGPSGFIQETNVINYAESGAPGFFTADAPIPGIPGVTGHANNFAMEAITWLRLEPGSHRFGISSDEGFRLQTSLNARDVASTVLGQHDGPRATAETVMDFIVQESGYYSFRLVWFQGEGPANLEWYSINQATGERVLINDPSHPDAIRAHRSGPFLPYLTFASPGPGTVAATNTAIQLQLANGTAAVVTNSIQLRLNGQLVSPNIAASGTNETAITFVPAASLAPGSFQTVALSYSDASQRAYTNQFSFSIAGGSQPVRLNIQALANNQISVTWSGGGTLEETTNLAAPGSWAPVNGAAGGQYISTPTGSRRFFRVRLQ